MTIASPFIYLIPLESKNMNSNQTVVDYYKILLCERTASTEQLKKSYQRLALSTHPDKQNGSNVNEKFALIQKAWSVLRDPESRRLYDASLTCQEHSETLLFDTISFRDMEPDADNGLFRYSCRCGGTYLLEASDSMLSEVVIGCDECSFSIQVNL